MTECNNLPQHYLIMIDLFHDFWFMTVVYDVNKEECHLYKKLAAPNSFVLCDISSNVMLALDCYVFMTS